MAYKTRGTILRGRARWNEQGERNTKYFYGLEKRNYSRKVVTKLQLNDGVYTTNQSDILEKQKNFYENLCKSQVSSIQSAQENEAELDGMNRVNVTPSTSMVLKKETTQEKLLLN